MSGLKELVAYKVMEQKLLHERGTNMAGGLEMLMDEETTRNLCARISPLRMAQVEACCEVMSISKQAFVLEALNDAINAVVDTLGDNGMSDWYDSAFDERLHANGFKATPPDKDGYIRYVPLEETA